MRPVAGEQTKTAKRWRTWSAFSKAAVNVHISTKLQTVTPSLPPHPTHTYIHLDTHCLESDSELTPKSAPRVYSPVKMNPGWSPINQVKQKGSNSQDHQVDQWPGLCLIINQIHGDYAGMMIPSFRGHYSGLKPHTEWALLWSPVSFIAMLSDKPQDRL